MSQTALPTGDHQEEQDLAEQALAQAIAQLGGSARDGQVQMTRRVAEVIADGTHLLVQAGTGTGKSLGYLVPAMTHAVTSGERAIVSTATLPLQRQIVTKDAPLAADAVEETTGTRPSVALLKGWQNYVCKHKLEGGYPSDEEPDGLFSAGEATKKKVGQGTKASLGEQVVRLREWAAQTDTGDRDDLVPGVSDRAWAQVSVAKAECVGPKCPLRKECFPELARSEAAAADVVVTNHAMLGVTVAGNSTVLPEHQVLVVDEAHELAERVRSQGTVTLSAAAVARIAATVRKRAGVVVTELETAGQTLQLALAAIEDGRLTEGIPDSIRDSLLLLDSATRQALTEVRAKIRDSSGASEEAGALAIARTALDELLSTLERLASDSVAKRRDVAWVDRPQMGSEPPRLVLAPIEVAGAVADTLLAEHTVVLTSATLTVGGSFTPLANTLGMQLSDTAWDGLDVGSPFDYPKQGILYTAAHLEKPGFGISDAALAEMTALAQAANGGMLGLFSSRRAAEDAAEYLREHTELTVYAQGEDQMSTLVEAFRADPHACLVGTLTLWQGVDVPGDTCRLVVIDRIPFPRPDDPVAQARAEVVAAGGGNGFMSVSATHAALLLAQGAGRLIRSQEDKGVVAVLDSRLKTARYGSFLTTSMPQLWPTTDGEVVRAALRRLAQ